MSGVDEESAASRRAQRSPIATARAIGTGALLASIPWIPGVRDAVGVGPETTWLVFGASAVLTLIATTAYHALGEGSRTYRVAALFEATSYAALPLWLVYASGRGESIFWIIYLTYAALNVRAVQYRAVLRALIGVPPVVLALAFLVVRGDPTSAVVSVLFGIGGVSVFEHGIRTSLRLAAANEERERLRVELVQHRVREERDRIARELHDGVGADLAALAWRAQRIRADVGDAEISAEMGTLIDRATQGIDELRSVVWAMRTPIRTWAELCAYARHRSEELCAGRAELVMRERGPAELEIDGEVGLHLVRMVQEAVRNAVRHGAPSRVVIELDAGPPLRVCVEDDGRGIPEDARARSEGGLENLRRRAAAMGGELRVESGARGTRLEVRLG